MDLDELVALGNAGEPGAALICGFLFENGITVEHDVRRARRFYRIAARAEIGTAQYALARMYGAGEGGKKDPKKAFDWARRAAESGNPAAQFYVGYSLELGVGTDRNIDEGFKWKEKAARQAFVPALRDLGIALAGGIMGEKDLNRAERYYRKAAKAGDRESAFLLSALLLEHRPSSKTEEALQWIKALAQENHPGALRQLGYAYLSGKYGFPKNKKKAKEFFDMADMASK